MKGKEVSRRYVYQTRKNGCYVPGSFYSVKELLDFIAEHNDITEIVETAYSYTEDHFCSRLNEKIIPLADIKQLKQVGYRIIMPRNVIEKEEIFHFSQALVKAKELGAEGLFETTRFFDRQGNEIVEDAPNKPKKPKTAHLLKGEFVYSDELPEIESVSLEPVIYLQKFREELADKRSVCLLTKSGVTGFYGRFVRSLNHYL